MTTLVVIHRAPTTSSDGSVPSFPPNADPEQRMRAGSVQPQDDGPRQGQPDVLAGVPDAVYRLDPEGRFTYLNAAAEVLMQRRTGELLGRRLVDVFPSTRGSLADERIREVLAEGQPRQFEYFYEPRERWFEVRAFPDPDGVAVLLRDVDARYRTDLRRDTELRELTAVLEALPSATVLVDEDGRILVANRAWQADGEILRSVGITPGGVGDSYLDSMSKGLRPADHAGVVAGFIRLQAEPADA